MQYPLSMSFKVVTLVPQIYIADASGKMMFYVRQKLFKLKEAITVFADDTQQQPLYKIGADRIIDFSARYNFSDLAGNPLGSIKRKGMRSLWQAHYEIYDGGGETPKYTIREENPWIRVADSCLEQIPLVGLFAGYFLNPSYLVTRSDGQGVMRLTKQPAFFEGKFKIDRLIEIDELEANRLLLGLMIMTLLERTRG
ncbi:MAG: hypothetical protein HYZ26_10465 [Chloroflexi bacterium]|nr:hypothetical protein [Chloroflexota bacterium]